MKKPEIVNRSIKCNEKNYKRKKCIYDKVREKKELLQTLLKEAYDRLKNVVHCNIKCLSPKR